MKEGLPCHIFVCKLWKNLAAPSEDTLSGLSQRSRSVTHLMPPQWLPSMNLFSCRLISPLSGPTQWPFSVVPLSGPSVDPSDAFVSSPLNTLSVAPSLPPNNPLRRPHSAAFPSAPQCPPQMSLSVAHLVPNQQPSKCSSQWPPWVAPRWSTQWLLSVFSLSGLLSGPLWCPCQCGPLSAPSTAPRCPP